MITEPSTKIEFKNQEGKICGWWKDGIYRKKVDSQKHKLKIMDAYGIDETIICEIEALGTKEIRIMEVDTGKILSTSFETFKEHSVTRNFQTFQRFLSVKYFNNEPIQ